MRPLFSLAVLSLAFAENLPPTAVWLELRVRLWLLLQLTLLDSQSKRDHIIDLNAADVSATATMQLIRSKCTNRHRDLQQKMIARRRHELLWRPIASRL